MTYWRYRNYKYDFRSAMYPKEMDPDELTPIIMRRVGEFRNGLTNPDRAIHNRWISTLSIVIKNFIKWSSLIGEKDKSSLSGSITRTDDLFVLGNVIFFAKIIDIQDVKDHFRVYLKSFKYREKALWFHVKNFFSKYNDLESLSQKVYRKFGFLHPEEGTLLFTQYSLLKDDLPDGTDFEDFLEELEYFLK